MYLIAMGKKMPLSFSSTLKTHCIQRLKKVLSLTVVFICCICLYARAEVRTEKISLSEKNASIEKIFDEIKKQTGYQFLYTTRIIENAKKVTITVKEASLEDVLKRCFTDQPFIYEIIDNTVVLKPRPADPNNPKKPAEIKGRIVNEKGEPVSGASIVVKGTLTRVLTNASGEFTIPGAGDNAILLISHVQYEDISFHVKEDKPVTITLQIRFGSLDDIQVIAYGTVTKRLNSGDVTSVKGRDIFKQPVTNPLVALQGQVAGLQVTQQTGVPGGGVNVLIRGRNSIINSNDPLYVIDGIPYASQLVLNPGSMATYNAYGNTSPSPMNFLNMADIESIDVLKDADATAIYGTRAANGVILITTKKGKPGKSVVDVNAYTGVAQVGNRMKLLNTDQFLEYRKEAFANDGATPGTLDYDLNGAWDKTKNVDWQKQLIGGNARTNDMQASVSGGSAEVQYMINGGYHKETTIYPGNFDNNKAAVHFNLNTISPNRKFKAQLSGGYVAGYTHLPYGDFMLEAKLYPMAPDVYDANGNLNWANSTWNNPYARMQAISKAWSKSLLSNGIFSYEIIPGLEAKASLGYTNVQFDDLLATPTTFNRPSSNVLTGNSLFGSTGIQAWVFEPQLKYKFSFSGGKFDLLVGSTIQQNQSEAYVIGATGYTDNSLLESMAAAGALAKNTVVSSQYKYNGVFARLNYNWEDKYIVNLTGRRDGSSRFGPESQFNNFAAAGAAWIFTGEEPIHYALPWLSFGKIRASYGTTGSDQVGDYRFLDIYTFTRDAVPYQTTQGLYPSNLFNPTLGWEINKKAEAGLEIGLLRDKLFFTASYFRNRSSNQLVGMPLSTVTGFGSIEANLPATVENAGWEFVARTHNVRTRDFRWISNVNFTIQKNKLVNFPDLEKSAYANQYIVGQPISIIQAYHSTGVDPQTGLYRFQAADGTATSAPSVSTMTDRYIKINPDPKFFGGFQNTFSFKNIEVDLFFLFVKQLAPNPLFLNTFQPGYFSRLTPANWTTDILNNRWQKAGDVASVQKFTRNTGAPLAAYTAALKSDYGYVDGSYIRLKNISVSYRLPDAWLRRIRCQQARIYFQGQNLFTITGYKGMDPEAQNLMALPPMRVLTGGIQLSL